MPDRQVIRTLVDLESKEETREVDLGVIHVETNPVFTDDATKREYIGQEKGGD